MKRREFLHLIGVTVVYPKFLKTTTLNTIPVFDNEDFTEWSEDLSDWDKIADSYKPSNDPFLEVFLNGKEVF